MNERRAAEQAIKKGRLVFWSVLPSVDRTINYLLSGAVISLVRDPVQSLLYHVVFTAVTYAAGVITHIIIRIITKPKGARISY